MRRYTYGELTDVDLQAHDTAMHKEYSDALLLYILNDVQRRDKQSRASVMLRTAYAMRKGWGKWK